jgi:hypothetical protein
MRMFFSWNNRSNYIFCLLLQPSIYFSLSIFSSIFRCYWTFLCISYEFFNEIHLKLLKFNDFQWNQLYFSKIKWIWSWNDLSRNFQQELQIGFSCACYEQLSLCLQVASAGSCFLSAIICLVSIFFLNELYSFT